MARLHVLAVAARLPAWAEAACAEYARRMPRGYEISRVAVKDDEALRSFLLKSKARRVALDERGDDLTTAQFAKLLAQETVFAIGGADGLPQDVKRDAQRTVRLSSMTLPHALAQVVLVEQLYRSATLLTGHPYHRA
ncbi:MAG TPA: 23S rRNA (pseudouridine(1915)-N(3))-methyltransferase RlmH [Burkholderiales bacterium]|nr:23S rRNA (pseudouridine(1915)-N(3))-methyltransferase RlmH [Burkholderiales bacterium]